MTQSKLGRFVWYDLLTTNTDAAIAFYAHILGWKAEPWEPDYTMFASEQGPLGGVATLPAEAEKMGAPPHWTSNVVVENVDATLAQAVKLGGGIIRAGTDYPKVGRLGIIADPQGAPISVYTPNRPLPPSHDTRKPGEFTWCELLTTDHEAAFRFHSALFGWEKLRDFDMGEMGKYLIYGVGGKELGGMFTKAKDMPMPAMWFYYVEVANLDVAIQRASAKGARVMNGPMSVPGGARIAQILDPQGAAFALHEAAKLN